MGADFDRRSMEHLMEVLPERDRGLLIMLGYILELRSLSPRSADEVINYLQRRSSRMLAEAGQPGQEQADGQTD